MRIISSLLLVGFLGFIVPLTSWHVLAHNHTSTHFSEHTKGLVYKQGVEKCSFCDLQLPFLFHDTVSVEISWKSDFHFLFIDYACSELPVKKECLSLRGPPVVDLF